MMRGELYIVALKMLEKRSDLPYAPTRAFKSALQGLLLISCILFGKNSFAQQKAMYSQYMFNALALNPAYSAYDRSLAITTLYRQQWVGLKGAPNTQTLTLHTPLRESNTSVGLMLMRDQIGEVIKEQGVYLTMAERVPVGEESYLAVGFNGGISSYQADYQSNFPSSPQSLYDPVFENQSELRANFGIGVTFFGPRFYAGISSPHFYYRPIANISNAAASTKYRPHYILQGGYVMDMGDLFKFKPHVILNYVNGSPLSADFNASLLIAETLWVGGSYRASDSFNAIAQYYITRNLALGYSYDFTTSELSKVQKGSHEISLKFRLSPRDDSAPRCYF